MTEEVYDSSLNYVSRNQVQNNLEMFPQATDSCVMWNSLQKMMWMQNIYMGSGGGQKSMLKKKSVEDYFIDKPQEVQETPCLTLKQV